MISITSFEAPYFFSLARLLLERAGTRDPFGLMYEDREMEARGTADGTALMVRSKGYAGNVPDMVVASRGPEGEVFERQHSWVAHHLETVVSRSIRGEHAFVFRTRGKDGAVAEATVLAQDLSDAARHVGREAGAAVTDLTAVLAPDEARARGMDPDAMDVTESLRDARDLDACRRSAEGSSEQVYLFTLMPREGKAQSWLARKTPHIRAVNLADAHEACLRSLDEGMRVVGIEIQTLAEFYEGPGSSRHARKAMVLTNRANAAIG